MSKKPGLASAVDKPTGGSGVTTLASRFESPEPSSSNPSTRVSDLASRFSKPSSTPTPSISTNPSKTISSSKRTTSPPSTNPTSPPNLSKKVSDLQRAFSTQPTTSDATLSARASAFSKQDSESKVTAFARKLDSSDGPTERVAGVARTFESRDTGIVKPAFAPSSLRGKDRVVEGEGKTQPVNEKVDRFDVVASRFEKGLGGSVEKDEEHGEGEGEGKARERFLDAAKRFGG